MNNKDELGTILAGVSDKTEIILVREEGVDPNDHYRENTPERITICVSFSEPGFGFGDISFVQQDGKVCIDTERMGREGVVHFLTKLLKDAIYDTDDNEANHLEYNRIMKRSCGNHCQICNKQNK